MSKKKKGNNIHYSVILTAIALFLFVIMIARLCQLALSPEIDGKNLQAVAASRVTKEETLKATRGAIYSSDNEVLVQTVASYKLIAHLNSDRTLNKNNPQHVVDKEYTAEKLATVINMSYEDILARLYKDKDGIKQVEFGVAGKGLSEIEKKKIEALNLPGIDFEYTLKRYYPKGDFASYTLGYAKIDENGNLKGEMGIEQYYDDLLAGVDGKKKYQKDLRGYQIAGTPVLTQEAQEGKNIYLTLDSNIQFYVEQAMKNSDVDYDWEWFHITIADAKTGKILGTATSPSFDPNIRNISNYLDILLASPFEPGSTMKTFTYMAAMENGVYNGNETYESGTYVTSDGTEIGDWNRNGWGTLTFDKGYAMSSNVAVINIINRHMNSLMLRQYYKSLGFGKKTKISLPNENKGNLEFKYETEIFNAGFGQGITVTPIQMIQAMTSLTNDGMLLKPYIVEKIVDPSNGEIILENERNELERVASTSTVQKMYTLMDDCVNGYGNTGSGYRIESGQLIGKTGTSQIADENGAGYLQGEEDIISSFAGIYPKDDPQIIIYAAVSKPSGGSQKPISNAVKEIVNNVSKYYGNADTKSQTVEIKKYTTKNYINKKLDNVKSELEINGMKYSIIGNGSKVIKQVPEKNTTITNEDIVYLITNDDNISLPDVNGMSGKNAKALLESLGIKVNVEGAGYVVSQSVSPGTNIKEVKEINIVLSPRF